MKSHSRNPLYKSNQKYLPKHNNDDTIKNHNIINSQKLENELTITIITSLINVPSI